MTASAMPSTPVSSYPHVDLNEGVAFIHGTTMKVVELVMAQKAHGWSPAELHFQYPHVSMSQVHAALAYYWDHRSELDADIERRSRFVEKSRAEVDDHPLVQRLRAQKKSACA